MEKYYNLKMPKEIYCGEGALEKISDILQGNEVKTVAIFTDRVLRQLGLLEIPLKKVAEANVQAIVLDDIPAEPTYVQVEKIIEDCKKVGADFIMAVGGGSVMDTAKLASILLTEEYSIQTLLEMPTCGKKQCKTLMIPTTAGTGSEATCNAIVGVPEKEIKVGIVNDSMMADYVILDVDMVKNLPCSIAAATGIDALAHAIECFTSKKATPFSDMFALQALKIILKNIVEACHNPAALDAKNQMQIASFYAGVAISASGTTAVHALSYPLGGKYHIPHGVANAILLVPVMRFNATACEVQLAQIYDVCIEGDADTLREKSEAIIELLAEIVETLQIPTSLKSFGICSTDIDVLTEAGMGVTRLLVNNMREMTHQDARSIYEQLIL